ncbi:Rrf2 family transcriptional regulator [Anaerocolumna sedimenticola]|uniref:Rrf2 family transcriptional regulator n=1 Tax=Anaerocolumna sedimenticola TaxID=2696063 RepID=A0A6P1TUK2_9FIRM|nr:Rrf2 family transcriptional regulator [Anaerocolumna sedimenticola]QHQ63366.1 Rrf2 family transcriptional regulator [Anaerocolumna sedimenticola]
MQLQITTDYAIRIVCYLAKHQNQLLTAREMSDQLGITYAYFIKVVSRIRQAGFIKSVQGSAGGYFLAKDAADITLYDIIEAMEGQIHINRCLENGRCCSRFAADKQVCQVHNFLESLQDNLITALKSKNICDI